LAILAGIALSAIVYARTAYNITRGQQSLSGFDPTLTSLDGLYIAQVAIGALGVLTISGEYGTGMIRAPPAAVP
jgi:ABC-2 type transport system permease protein